MVLFFKASSQAARFIPAAARSFSQPLAANQFDVTGSYTAQALSGSITGTLVGTPANGTFDGTLTATLPNGCVASRRYSGTLTSSTLSWTPGDDINNCFGQTPLTFAVTTLAAADPAPAPVSGTYAGPFSVPVPLFDPVGGCVRTDRDDGTLTLKLTVLASGAVTGTGHAVGLETTASSTQVLFPTLTCSQSQVGTTSHYETVADDALGGTTSYMTFFDTQTLPIQDSPGGPVTFTATFTGSFVGNTIVGLFTNTEHIERCNAITGTPCDGSATSKVTLTRQ
jgi:hypothetical protein